MDDYNDKKDDNKLLVFGKGIIISMLMTLLMIFILSIVLCYSNVSESVIVPSIIFISSFSILCAAYSISKKVDKNGIVYGSVLGILYMISIYLISSIINSNFSLGLNSFIMIALGIIGGAIGGIIGINLK